MQRESADVVVIGGGISGTAAAYELARAGVSVTLLDRGDLASMASGWTLAGVRQSGRHPAEMPLAQAAVRCWQTLGDELDADLEYRQEGNLRLALTPDEVPPIAKLVEDQRALGLDLEFLPDTAAVRAVAPALAETVAAASYCPTDGHANPTATVRAFAAAAGRHGAEIRIDTTVTAITVANGRVTGVTTSAGDIAVGSVVVAAGIYSGDLCAPLGVDLPISITHVCAVQTIPLPPLLKPVLGTAHAIFAGRQQADGRFRMTGGVVPWQAPDGELTADEVQPPVAKIAHTLARGMEIVPALAEAKIARVWGGLIDMTPDALPVIERSPRVEGLVITAGFSGHGFCLGPLTGQIIRELVTDGQSSFPLAPFQGDRFDAAPGASATELHG